MDHDGLAGYEKSVYESYDLFILDERMPLVLGTELIEGLKRNNPQAKIILISSFADRALQKEITKPRCAAFIQHVHCEAFARDRRGGVRRLHQAGRFELSQGHDSHPSGVNRYRSAKKLR